MGNVISSALGEKRKFDIVSKNHQEICHKPSARDGQKPPKKQKTQPKTEQDAEQNELLTQLLINVSAKDPPKSIQEPVRPREAPTHVSTSSSSSATAFTSLFSNPLKRESETVSHIYYVDGDDSKYFPIDTSVEHGSVTEEECALFAHCPIKSEPPSPQNQTYGFQIGEICEVLIEQGFCAGEWKRARIVHKHEDGHLDVYLLPSAMYSIGYSDRLACVIPQRRVRRPTLNTPVPIKQKISTPNSIVRYIELSGGESINPDNYTWSFKLFPREQETFSSEKLLPQHILLALDHFSWREDSKKIRYFGKSHTWTRMSQNPEYAEDFSSPFTVTGIHKNHPKLELHLSACIYGYGTMKKFVSLDPQNRYPPELGNRNLTNDEYMDAIEPFIEEVRKRDEVFIVRWQFLENSLGVGRSRYGIYTEFKSVTPGGIKLSPAAIRKLQTFVESLLLKNDPSVFVHSTKQLKAVGPEGLREVYQNRRRVRTVDEVVPGLCKNVLEVLDEFLPVKPLVELVWE